MLKTFGRLCGAMISLGSVALGALALAVGHWGLALIAFAGAGLVLGAVVSAPRVSRRWALAACAFGGGLVVLRLTLPREPEGWSVCVDGQCTPNGPWWSRLLPEAASIDAGFLLSSWAGITRPEEATSYRAAFDAHFAQLPDVPNAALLISTEQTVRGLVYEPPGTGALPCVVFLHGFGGLSSVYSTRWRPRPWAHR